MGTGESTRVGVRVLLSWVASYIGWLSAQRFVVSFWCTDVGSQEPGLAVRGGDLGS